MVAGGRLRDATRGTALRSQGEHMKTKPDWGIRVSFLAHVWRERQGQTE